MTDRNDKVTGHPSREVHPDWGFNIAQFMIYDTSNMALGKWFEAGSSVDQGDWDPSTIYTTVGIGPQSGGSDIDWVLQLQNPNVNGKKVSAPTAHKWQEPSSWNTWNGGAGLLKIDVPADYDQAYVVYEASLSGSSWTKTGSVLGVMAVDSAGDMHWWVARSSTGASVSLGTFSLASGSTALYFSARTKIEESAGANQIWYHAEDDKI